MHKHTETKPDGRRLYYYRFEPAADAPPPNAPCPEPADDTPPPASEQVHSTHHAALSMADPDNR